MENVSLNDLVSKLGQARVARALGVKPASIAKAIRTCNDKDALNVEKLQVILGVFI